MEKGKSVAVKAAEQKCILHDWVIHVTACLRLLCQFESVEAISLFSPITSLNWNEILYRYQNGDEKITKYVLHYP